MLIDRIDCNETFAKKLIVAVRDQKHHKQVVSFDPEADKLLRGVASTVDINPQCGSLPESVLGTNRL